jgi:hypothetical protein
LEAFKILAQDSDLHILGVLPHGLQANSDQGAIDIALDNSNIEILVELIERGHVPMDRDRALKFACEQNNAALVRLIIKSCVISGVPQDNIAALEAAVWKKNTEVIAVMIPVTSDTVLETLLSKAAAGGQCQILTLILSAIPRNIDARRMIRQMWPNCLRNGFVKAARSVLQHWIKVDLAEGYQPGLIKCATCCGGSARFSGGKHTSA